MFGPDTSTAWLPWPHLLLYYWVFFFFGVLYFDTKEEDDLALHGKAYSLAVRLRDVPILML